MENLDKPIAIDKIIRKIMRFDVEKASKWKWLHNWILSNLLDTDNYNVIQILATQSVVHGPAQHHWEFAGNAEAQVPTQTYWIRPWIFTSSLSDLCVHELLRSTRLGQWFSTMAGLWNYLQGFKKILAWESHPEILMIDQVHGVGTSMKKSLQVIKNQRFKLGHQKIWKALRNRAGKECTLPKDNKNTLKTNLFYD